MKDPRITCSVSYNGADYRIDYATPTTFAEWFAGLGAMLAANAYPYTRFEVRHMDTVDAARP